jgi:hypothetical protein
MYQRAFSLSVGKYSTSARRNHTLDLAFEWHRQLRLREAVITYMLMSGLGLVLASGAQYGDRAVTRYEPSLAEINPSIPKIFFAAKTLGLMIVAVGAASTAATVYA